MFIAQLSRSQLQLLVRLDCSSKPPEGKEPFGRRENLG